MNLNERDLKDLNVFLRTIRDAVEDECRANVEYRFERYGDRRRGCVTQSAVDEQVDEIVHHILGDIASEAVARYRHATDATDE